MNKPLAIIFATVTAAAQLAGGVAALNSRQGVEPSGNEGYLQAISIANNDAAAVRKSGTGGDALLSKILSESAEDYFEQNLKAYEKASGQKLPADVARLEYNGAFLNECRAQNNAPSAVVSCAATSISADKAEAWTLYAGIGGGVPATLLLGGFLVSGFFRVSDKRRAAAEAEKRRAAEEAAEAEAAAALKNKPIL